MGWCRDWYVPYEGGHRAGDGALLVQPAGDGRGLRVYRGGSFNYAAFGARSAFRYGYAPGFRRLNLSCRAAKGIER